MYLKRKIDVFLENWKVQNGRKPPTATMSANTQVA